MKPTRRTALLVLLSFALSGTIRPAPAAAADPDPSVQSATSTGERGIPEPVSLLMSRQAALDAVGPILKDMEAEIEQPDRRGLPQNPASPRAAQFPEFTPGLKTAPDGPRIESPQSIGTSFTAATLAGVNPTLSFPPDCMGAVGPSQYVVFVNGRLVTFNKNTGVGDGVLNVDPDVFFTSVRNGSSTSDPRIRYDRLTGRWFLAIINVSTPNRILVAVSDAASAGTITPGTVFTFYFINIATTPPVISNTCLADYPTLGLDANALYVGANNFCGSPSQTFNSTDGYVIRKSSIMSGGPLVVTVFRGLVASSAGAGPYTPQGVDNFDPAASEGFFIGVDNATFGTLMMRRVTNPGGTPTVSANISITVPATRFPLLVPHLGNTGGANGNLSSLDDRLFMAHIRNGRLWTAHNIGVNNTGVASGTLTRNGSRWYELNVPPVSGTPTVVQSGTVFTATGTNGTAERHYWIPSIMVSGQGHAALGFSTAGTNERANAATVGRLAGDALGSMQTPVLITASSTAYNPPSDPGGAGIGRRWGDYSYVSLDPLDDMTMWSVDMFCNAANSYGVRVTKLIAPPPATPAGLADITAGQNPVNLTLTGVSVSGSGFFDPGADLPGVPAFNHLSASITNGGATGTPPTVVSAAYVNPTTVNLVLDASAATGNIGAEKYTLTITNPDGQTAAAAVVHVVGGVTPVATIDTGPAAAEGDAGPAAFNFTVNLSSPATSAVTIHYSTSDGSATVADTDYQGATSSIIIPVNGTSGTIPVNVNGDTKFEGNETFTVTLTSAVNATLGATVAATGTINNDDLPPVVSIDNVSLAEGDVGTTAFNFTVSLSQASGVAASVAFTTTDGTATLAHNDYQTAGGPLNFAAGVTSLPVTILVNGDEILETDEAFTVNLSSPVNLQSGSLVGTGTILNDDGVPSVSAGDAAVAEGDAGTTALVFTVSLSNPSDQPVTVQYQTNDGTATIGDSDYQATSGPLTIPAKTLSAQVTVLLNGDLCNEANETFTLDLSAPAGAVLGDASGTGTIQNDDDASAPSVTVAAPDGGDNLIVGNPVNILWSATDNLAVTTVDIRLSRDGGATYPEVLASGIGNSGSFGWNVSGPPVAAGQAFVQVQAHDANCNTGTDVSNAGFEISDPVTAVQEFGPVTEFGLGNVYPNPTRGTAQIEFQLPQEAPVQVKIVDVRGREVAPILSGSMPAGRYRATWTGQTSHGPAAKGVYFVRYEAGGKVFTRRLVLAR